WGARLAGRGGVSRALPPRLGLPSEPRPPRRAPRVSKTVSKLPRPEVREWRRPISVRLPFCEFNSEAPGLCEDAFAAPLPVQSGARGEKAASLRLRGGVFHIGAFFGVCNLAVGR
ncbi:hypothetical protein MC885_013194, partial [Smutsia gigantea]